MNGGSWQAVPHERRKRRRWDHKGTIEPLSKLPRVNLATQKVYRLYKYLFLARTTYTYSVQLSGIAVNNL